MTVDLPAAGLRCRRAVHREQSTEVVGKVGRPPLLWRREQVSRPGHTGEDEHAVHAGTVRALDVGVEPVADHQRTPAPRTLRRLAEQRRFRLAHHEVWPATQSRSERRYQRAVAGQRSPGRGQRTVGVGRHPAHPAPYRHASLGAPTTSTGLPAGRLVASSLAAATAEVTTSSAVAGTPSDASSAATSAGRREALLVTKATGIPAARNRATASEAPGIGWSPR